MSRARSFDWDEAERLRAAGMTYRELAARFGKTYHGIRYALDPEFRRRLQANHAEWQRRGSCPDCGAQTTRHSRDADALCVECANTRRLAVRPGEAWCSDCRCWHPLAAFNQAPTRRGVRNYCVQAETARRRAYREAHPEVEAAATERQRRARRRAATS